MTTNRTTLEDEIALIEALLASQCANGYEKATLENSLIIAREKLRNCENK